MCETVFEIASGSSVWAPACPVSSLADQTVSAPQSRSINALDKAEEVTPQKHFDSFVERTRTNSVFDRSGSYFCDGDRQVVWNFSRRLAASTVATKPTTIKSAMREATTIKAAMRESSMREATTIKAAM